MTYCYTQISHYLSCPRRYKHRYLDGWKEKDTRAAMLFGRAFEQALAAYFQRQVAAEVLYRECAVHRDGNLNYYDHHRCGSGGVCAQAAGRDSVFPDCHQPPTTRRIWSPGSRFNPKNRISRVSAPQWHPLSPEPLH